LTITDSSGRSAQTSKEVAVQEPGDDDDDDDEEEEPPPLSGAPR
jgi:hypothetical protein